MDCVDCTTGLDHCHGTLVVHPGGLVDCTEWGCTDLEPVRHTFAIDCGSLLGGCDCTTTAVVEALPRAS
jgi:hypothetical protein